MVRIEHTALLEGDAASFKGGRAYVHATDLIPALDALGGTLPRAPILHQVDFHSPLTNRGVVHVATDLDLPSRLDVSATGRFTDADGVDHPFVVFPSPLPILHATRLFDEEGLWPACALDEAAGQVSAAMYDGLTLPEQMSSMMKLLCKTLLPRQGRWWFVRLTKPAPLPAQVARLILTKRRIIAERMVSADITTEAGALGRIDFVGKPA
ncbi:MAG: hypothetical protein JJT81_17680 [Rubellimicrobium sp.]|nr:hypothetical protein [Rubellimicrobium sp.]